MRNRNRTATAPQPHASPASCGPQSLRSLRSSSLARVARARRNQKRRSSATRYPSNPVHIPRRHSISLTYPDTLTTRREEPYPMNVTVEVVGEGTHDLEVE